MLSIIVNFHNNRREAVRTLHSLRRSYQRDGQRIEYEVIVTDHNSLHLLDENFVRSHGENFHYYPLATPDCITPTPAIAKGLKHARGEHLMIVIDGAHILSPGVLYWASKAFSLFDNPFIATVPFHLGPGPQNETVSQGYNQQAEDELLAKVKWEENGYRLFDAAGAFSDTSLGWFGCLFESNCFALKRSTYDGLGGLDPAFTTSGGGMVNLDFFRRAVMRRELDYVMLLGEGTFHQFHGGVASNAPLQLHPLRQYQAEYTLLRGQRHDRFRRRPVFLGEIPQEALKVFQAAAAAGFEWWAANPPEVI